MNKETHYHGLAFKVSFVSEVFGGDAVAGFVVEADVLVKS